MPRWLLIIVLVPMALVVWVGPASSSGEDQGSPTGQPALDLVDAANLTSLPATVGGTLRNYHKGVQVSFHLDSPDGPTLAGSISPDRVGEDGQARVSVTIPAGTPNGEHTIYAVGVGDDGAP